MVVKKLFFWGFTFLMISQSCAWNKHGHLTKRYHKATSSDKNDTVDVKVKAYAFSVKPAVTQPKTFFDLSDTSQKYLIMAYNQKDTTSLLLNQSIARPFQIKKTKKTSPFYDNRICFKKRIVFSVRNTSLKPENRIWKLEVNLTTNAVDDKFPLKYSSCSSLITEFETTDVGKLSYTSNSSLSGNLNASTGTDVAGSTKKVNENSETTSSFNNNNSVGVSGTGTTEAAFSEEVTLKQRRVKLSPSVTEKELSIYRESITGMDLTGNIIANVELCPVDNENIQSKSVYEFSNLITKSKASSADKIMIKRFVVSYPDIKSDITAKVNGKAVVRIVKKNGNTISESDDEVFFEQKDFEEQDNVTLITKNELVPNFWNISYNKGKKYVKIKSVVDESFNTLRFRTYPDATDFLVWLKNFANENRENELDELALGYKLADNDGQKLTLEMINGLSVDIEK